LLPAFRYQADRVRLQIERKLGHRRRASHLQIEPGRLGSPQTQHVLILDMPAILPQMDGNAIRTGLLATKREVNRIGLDVSSRGNSRHPVTGLTQGGTVINIDAEKDHDSSQYKETEYWESVKTPAECFLAFRFGMVPPCLGGMPPKPKQEN